MDAFEALSDPVRRELLRRVATHPLRAGELALGHGISRPAVSRHLRLLVEAGLVEPETRGRERYFRLRPAGTAPVVELVEELRAAAAVPPTLTGGPTPGQWLALDTEVRRTGRDRRREQTEQGSGAAAPQEEIA